MARIFFHLAIQQLHLINIIEVRMPANKCNWFIRIRLLVCMSEEGEVHKLYQIISLEDIAFPIPNVSWFRYCNLLFLIYLLSKKASHKIVGDFTKLRCYDICVSHVIEHMS